MNYVYVSYGASDIFCAGQLKKLIKKTVVTWCAEDDMPCGADAGEVIPSKIKGASAFLLILSPWAVNSKQVYRELLLADKYGVPVIPVKAGRVDLPEKFEYFLCDVTIKDISGFEYDSQIASSLIDELIKIAGKTPEDILKDEVKEEVRTVEIPVAVSQDEPCNQSIIKIAEDNAKEQVDRIKALLPVFAPEEERETADYTSITFAEDVISTFLCDSGANCELSLVTEGPSFTRFIYAFGGEIKLSVIENLTEVLHEKISPDLPVDVHLDETHDSIVVDIPADEKKNVKISSFLKDKKTEEYLYPYPVGKDVNENCIIFDFKEGGNLLVSGGDADERAAFLNAAVLFPAVKNEPKDYSVILSDGDGRLAPVNALANICAEEKISSDNVTDADMIKIISPLDFILNECENRKQLFFLASDNDNKIDTFDSYNASGVDEKLPLLLVVIGGIDENYAPLKETIEDKLLKIKSCEKYGIRLVMSSSVIGGDALSVFEEKVYFKGKSEARGTENLTGGGDLIFVTPDYSVRAQCAALTFEEAVDAIGILNGMDTKICDDAAAAFIKSAAIRNFREYTKKLQPVQLTLNDMDLFVGESAEKADESEVAESESEITEEKSEEAEIVNADNADDSFAIDDETVENIIADENISEDDETAEKDGETGEETENPAEDAAEPETIEDEEVAEEVETVEESATAEDNVENTEETEISENVETEENDEVAEPDENVENEETPEEDEAVLNEEPVKETDEEFSVGEEGEVILEDNGEKVNSFVENYSVPTAIEVDEDNLEGYYAESEESENSEEKRGELSESEDIGEEPKEEYYEEEPAEENGESEFADESEEKHEESETESEETIDTEENTQEIIPEDINEDTDGYFEDDEAEYFEDKTVSETQANDVEEAENVGEAAEEEQETEPEEIFEGWTYVPEEERPAKIYLDALKLFIDRNRVGISILQQRPLMLNYYKAAKIVDWMTEKGYVSKPDAFGNRTLLISLQDYYDMYK